MMSIPSTERHFASAPNGDPGPFYVSCLDRRTAAPLDNVEDKLRTVTFDNVHAVSPKTDTESLRIALHKDPALLEEKDKFFQTLSRSVVDPHIRQPWPPFL